MPPTRHVPRLDWTDSPEANRLVAEDPLALLIGFCLDQQIPIEWAFLGPLKMRERLGTLDAEQLARTDPEAFAAAFRQVPAIHRFPGSMAARVLGICRIVAQDYGGDAARIWMEAGSGRELHRRLAGLPGFGAAKAGIVIAVLAKHFDVKPAGWEALVPQHPTLADVSTAEQRREYQARKRAYKASLRARNPA